MLRHTFIHIPGIGPRTEQALWKKGIRSWGDFPCAGNTVFSPRRDARIREELDISERNGGDIGYFSSRLPSGEMWRLFEPFRQRAVYLDIETGGEYEGSDDITVIGICGRNGVQTFVSGINLNDFEIAVSSYDLVITFNGASFDLPVIRRGFRNISLPEVHIDLRFLLRRLGYRGGLKRIEKTMGIVRETDIEGMGGYEAVMLWRAYQQGDRGALDRLVRYNTADTVNLEPLMERAYREMKDRLLPKAGPSLY